MTGQEYYNYFLTKEEQDQWMLNFRDACIGTHTEPHTYIENKMYRGFNDFNDFISGSFSWADTPQGFQYWDVISERTKPVNKKQVFKMTPLKFM